MESLFLLDGQGKAFTLKEKVLYFLIAAFFISLFLPDMPVVVNIIIGAIIFLSLFYPTFREKGRLLRQRKEIALMTLFFGINIVSGLISTNLKEGLEMLVLRLPLLVFPLSIGLLVIREKLKDRILLAYGIIVTLAAVVCTVYSIYRYQQSGDTGYLYDDSLSELVRRQSVYVALMVNLAVVSYVYLLLKGSLLFKGGLLIKGGPLIKGSQPLPFKAGAGATPGVTPERPFVIQYPWLAYLSIAFLVVFHFMLASRISIITLYASFVVFVAWYSIRKKKFLKGIALVLALAIVAFGLVKLFPKTLNRFRELNYTNYSYGSHAVESHYNMQLTADQWNGANIRLAVWNCGWELARQHWLIGVPLGDKRDKLVEVYKARHFDFGVATRRDMHNSYLDVLCNFGVIGLGIFLLGYLVFPLAASYRGRDGWRAFIIVAFAAAMISECWLDTGLGCILLGFFLCFACGGDEA
jgi:O-antigen ligase